MRRFSRSRNALRAIILISIQMFSTAVFTIWFLYVWAQNSRFGSLPDCNHLVKYVLFFASVPATTTWLRAFFIVGIVFASCSLLFKFGTVILFLKTKLSEEQCSSIPDEEEDDTGWKPINEQLQEQLVFVGIYWICAWILTFRMGCVSPIDSLSHVLSLVP